MTLTDPTALAVLAGVRADPDDDTARLVWADRLDEIGEPDRAELVRVQVELVQRPFGWGLCGPGEKHTFSCVSSYDRLRACNAHGHRGDHLRAREVVLVAANDRRWRAGPKCERCDGKKTAPNYPVIGTTSGFPCPDCGGTGDAGGLMLTEGDFEEYNNTGNENARTWVHRVTYHRGTARVTVPTLAECVREVPDHDNNDRATVPSKWLLRVVTHHPDVTEVWCENPGPSDHESGVFAWYKSALPEPIFNLIQGHYGRTEEIACTALARILVTWARTFIKETK